MSMVYRFTFSPSVSDGQIESRLFLAAVNTENVFGEAAMRLDASFRFDRRTRVCVIDGSTEVGQHIARLFIAYISKEFGEDSHTVERVDKAKLAPPAPAQSGVPASDQAGEDDPPERKQSGDDSQQRRPGAPGPRGGLRGARDRDEA